MLGIISSNIVQHIIIFEVTFQCFMFLFYSQALITDS
jgi:hypothetical protein